MIYFTRLFRSNLALALLPMLLLLFSLTPAQAQTGNEVHIVVNPATSQVEVGQNFVTTIQVQAGSADINGISAYLDFDPSLLQVQSMTPVTSFPFQLQNTYDNNNGQLNYSVATFSLPYPTGFFDLLQVEFKKSREDFNI